MPSKNHYDVLAVATSAAADEIKRAFRHQIARYHPDKVQHLGPEFQNMAAERAAELTEAYRVLSDEGQRAEYDRGLAAHGPAPAPAQARPQGAATPVERDGSAPPPPHPEGPPPSTAYTEERASRDEFVRKATMGRIRQALKFVGKEYDESQAPGFDLACVPRAKLFGRATSPRLLGRFVPRVDGPTVKETWPRAGRWVSSPKDEVCVLLFGSSVAPARELADAIAEQRRRSHGAKVTIIPIDSRNWDAHMPVDAPAIAKDLLARLKSGT